MREMKISDKAKKRFHIESGKCWTPSYMGSTIYVFTMRDLRYLEAFKTFLADIGLRITCTNGVKIYAK